MLGILAAIFHTSPYINSVTDFQDIRHVGSLADKQREFCKKLSELSQAKKKSPETQVCTNSHCTGWLEFLGYPHVPFHIYTLVTICLIRTSAGRVYVGCSFRGFSPWTISSITSGMKRHNGGAVWRRRLITQIPPPKIPSQRPTFFS